MNSTELVVIVAALAAIALVNWWFFVAGKTVAMASSAPTAVSPGTTGASTRAEAMITVDGGYAPNTVRASAGTPLRLVFDRRDDSSCSEEVVFPSLGIRRFLPAGERTAIDITPTEAGRIPFTCGMGMLKGSVLVDAR